MTGPGRPRVPVQWIPPRLRQWLRARQRRHRLQWPRVGTVGIHHLLRPTPVSRVFGLDRGLPIDRYYIESFLAAHAGDIRGHVLEIGDDRYTRRFGAARVTARDVLQVPPGGPSGTIAADLAAADDLPGEQFDCAIVTQTLQMIFDVRPAIGHLARLLRSRGVILATAHGISRVARREGIDPWGEYWHFTSQSLARLFREHFPAASVQVTAYGNVLAAVASLHGLAAEELAREDLDFVDPDYEVLIGLRAVKSG